MSPVTVVINKILLGWVAFGAGFAVAGGFIAFISLIGIAMIAIPTGIISSSFINLLQQKNKKE